MEFWIYDFGDLEKWIGDKRKGIKKRHCEWRNGAKQSHDSGKDKEIGVRKIGDRR